MTEAELGMAWWNHLTEPERAQWLHRARSAVPADAWAAFRRAERAPRVEIRRGDLLDADAEALVNPVNTAGAMGKGLALQFRRAFPGMYAAYRAECRAGRVLLGRMHVYEVAGLGRCPRWIINFPTKAHWRDSSRIGYIEAGLVDLVATIRRHGITSVAVPALGCGLGGLHWSDVRPLIVAAFEPLHDVRACLFEP